MGNFREVYLLKHKFFRKKEPSAKFHDGHYCCAHCGFYPNEDVDGEDCPFCGSNNAKLRKIATKKL